MKRFTRSNLRIGRLRVAYLATPIFLAGAFLLNMSFAQAAIPTTMNFQGRLANSSGVAMPNGLYNMKFRIWTASSGGSQLWTETRETTNRVQVTNGLFSTQIGAVTPLTASIFNNASTLYFEIELPTPATATCSTASCQTWTEGAMTPRSVIAASAYAMNSATLDGIGASGFIQNQSGSAQTTSNFWLSGSGRADVSLQAPLLDTATAATLSLGTTNATSITLAKDTTIAAGKSLTLAGGNTASRPASPTEGMVYYDTTTKQLLTYSNGKWQADSKSATFIVAASDSSQVAKDGAQYVTNGEDSSGSGIGTLDGDQIEINNALTAASSVGGGTVYLTEGTYTIDAAISIPNNVALVGTGNSTVIQLGNFGASSVDVDMITNADTSLGRGVMIRDLTLNGRSDLNTGGTQIAINLNNVGASGVGAVLDAVHIIDFGGGISLSASSNSTVKNSYFENVAKAIELHSNSQNNTLQNNTINNVGDTAIRINSSDNNIIINNSASGIAYDGINLFSSDYNTISGNKLSGIGHWGLSLWTSKNNKVSGNIVRDSGGDDNNDGIFIAGSNGRNSITDNVISDSSATMTNYALIADGNADYYSNNLFYSDAGDATISDNGDSTFANQPMAENGMNLLNRTLNSTTAFTIQGTNKVNVFNIDTVNGEIELGNSTTAGKLVLSDGYSNTLTISTAALAGNYTLGIPTMTSNDTLCLVTAANCANGTMFIQNQNASAQTANSWVNGTARADTAALTPRLDTASAGALTLGNTNATSISLGKAGVTTTANGALTSTGLLTGNAGATVGGGVITLNSSGASAVNINTGTSTGTTTIGNSTAGAISVQSASTVGISGTTTVTGLTGGVALTVSNSTSTGNILELKDNTTSVFTVADGGAVMAKNTSTAAFSIQNAGGYNLFTADTSANRLVLGTPGGDTIGTLLVLGNKTTAGDPTGEEGAMYYNTSKKAFRCYENGSWRNCMSSGYELADTKDEFLGGASDSKGNWSAGDLGWECRQTYGSEPPCWASDYGADSNHPGVLKLAATTDAANDAGSISTEPFTLANFDRMTWIFKTYDNTNNRYNNTGVIRIGMFNDLNSLSDSVSDGVYLQFNRAVSTTNWYAISKNDGTETATQVAAIAANTWYRLEIVRNSSSNYEVYINGTLATTLSTNKPSDTADGMVATSIVKNVNSAVSSGQDAAIDIDFFSIRTKGLTR